MIFFNFFVYLLSHHSKECSHISLSQKTRQIILVGSYFFYYIYIMDEKELYRQIELAIIIWSNDGTKTAGTLTREIIEIIKQLK